MIACGNYLVVDRQAVAVDEENIRHVVSAAHFIHGMLDEHGEVQRLVAVIAGLTAAGRGGSILLLPGGLQNTND